ncbi:hypothetical protein FDZ71_02540, partial [bacterium]
MRKTKKIVKRGTRMKNKMEFSRHGLIRSRFGSGGLGFVRLGPEEETDDIFMVVQNEQRDEE